MSSRTLPLLLCLDLFGKQPACKREGSGATALGYSRIQVWWQQMPTIRHQARSQVSAAITKLPERTGPNKNTGDITFSMKNCWTYMAISAKRHACWCLPRGNSMLPWEVGVLSTCPIGATCLPWTFTGIWPWGTAGRICTKALCTTIHCVTYKMIATGATCIHEEKSGPLNLTLKRVQCLTDW